MISHSFRYKVYNIGGGQPENLLDFVNILQEDLVRAGVLPQDYDFEAHKQLVPMQPGDVPTTYADRPGARLWIHAQDYAQRRIKAFCRVV